MSRYILDTIDQVLDDYTAGPDAMRWTPTSSAVTTVTPTAMFVGGVDLTGYVSSIEVATESAADAMRSFTATLQTVSITFEGFFEPMHVLARTFARTYRAGRGPGIRRRSAETGLQWLSRVDLQVRSHPKPLAINGVAYRRRQRARTRRTS